MRFRKPELIPLLFIICAEITLIGLGAWQVERLQWKQAILAQIEQAQQEPVLGTLPQELDKLEYRQVALTGTFIYDKVFHLIAPQHGSVSGYSMDTPFVLEDDGRVILVDRGFSPPGQEARPEGVQTIKGVIRPLRPKRYFAPANDTAKNLWFYEDLGAMSHAAGQELTPIVVQSTESVANGYPIAFSGKISLRNDHLQYAITWFSVAIIGIIMFAFYHRIPENRA